MAVERGEPHSYDNADRITGAQDTENGQCTTRVYIYDADSNRTRLTTYAPSTDGTCQNTSAAYGVPKT